MKLSTPASEFDWSQSSGCSTIRLDVHDVTYRGHIEKSLYPEQKVLRMTRISLGDAASIFRAWGSDRSVNARAAYYIGFTEQNEPFMFRGCTDVDCAATWNLYQSGREIARRLALDIERFYSGGNA